MTKSLIYYSHGLYCYGGMIDTMKSFRYKIIIPTVIVLVALVFVLNFFLSVRFSALSETLVHEKLVSNCNSLKFYLEDSKANTKVAATSMAHNPEAVKAIAERDTAEILRLFSSVKDLYRISYFTICDDTGTVLMRTHEPGITGDSLLEQQNARDALAGKVSTYIEPGTVTRVSVRTGAPVYGPDGSITGTITAGVRLDSDDEVEKLKELFNTEVTVFFGNIRIATTITRDGESIVGTKLNPDLAKIVLENKQEYSGDVNIYSVKYTAFYMPLLDSGDEAFAAIFLGIPEAEIIAAIKKSSRDGTLLGLSGLAASIILLFVIITSISQPIVKLSDDMDQIANGDLCVNINVKSNDEVGHLGRSLQKVADILHKLLDDINVMIAEHEKGNIDYSLDTDKFLGDYKVLAGSVVELASLGMRDQLTGIPNRRSFDNRLKQEWNRAVRDKKSLSVMILDVDKFKNYNDTFGHQQGDVALKTVARTIKNSVKRLIDFAARWGGEEFTVLLPSTNSEGARRVAEKIRKAVEDAKIACDDPKGEKITVSVGISVLIPSQDSSIESFISTADAALYKAKETGRNRVVMGGEADI